MEHCSVEVAPRGERARGEVGEPSRVPVCSLSRELEAQLAWPLRHRDLVRAEQMSKLKDVGCSILLPLKWAKVLGRRADPVCSCCCRRCLEQTGFQACLSLCRFPSICTALVLMALFPIRCLFLMALFSIRCLLHLQLEKLH